MTIQITPEEWKRAVAQRAFEADLEGRRSQFENTDRKGACRIANSAEPRLRAAVDGAVKMLELNEEDIPEFGTPQYLGFVHPLADRLDVAATVIPARMRHVQSQLSSSFEVTRRIEGLRSDQEWLPKLAEMIRKQAIRYEFSSGLLAAIDATFTQFGINVEGLPDSEINSLDTQLREGTGVELATLRLPVASK